MAHGHCESCTCGSDTLHVYELHAGSQHVSYLSTSATVERAKQDAEERLEFYRKCAEEDPEAWSDIALTETLTWELRPFQFGSHPAMVERKPRWTASVSDNPSDIFTIREIEVLT